MKIKKRDENFYSCKAKTNSLTFSNMRGIFGIKKKLKRCMPYLMMFK